jgi:hypothetical protein
MSGKMILFEVERAYCGMWLVYLHLLGNMLLGGASVITECDYSQRLEAKPTVGTNAVNNTFHYVILYV